MARQTDLISWLRLIVGKDNRVCLSAGTALDGLRNGDGGVNVCSEATLTPLSSVSFLAPIYSIQQQHTYQVTLPSWLHREL